jgi:hypothetical protein
MKNQTPTPSRATKPDPSNSVEITPAFAARALAAALGEPESTWGIRLANWRRPGRTSPIPWHTSETDAPVFELSDVQAFIDRTLSQRAATTAPTPGAVETVKATAVADVEDGQSHVRVFWNAGTAQGGFGLSAAAARQLAHKLVEAANKAALAVGTGATA